MDTWSTVRLMVDLFFALLVAGAVAGFLYHRERRLKQQLAGILSQVAPSQTDVQAEVQEEMAAAEANPRLSRAEKYLEAVRMYRSGKDSREIEKRLGISLVELELLGKAT